ncbi:gastric inhibitory polypeptide [Protobothrops mucrosquamatus]|uniref:gastric inhibitory polypeptide n=1 Tax=Protobothrops mucrosquamatus TaxID=103944 RepID=UPI0010FB5CFC|nr:gastric inhibitory polypeptide [Protobothrops mucrosquamatus]
MVAFKVVSLLLISLSFVLMEENSIRENLRNSTFLQRRYSEGTLASDYSRTLDNMLKKNFVEWLLNHRENKNENKLELSKRKTDITMSNERNQGNEAGRTQEAKDYVGWLLQIIGKQRLSFLMDSDEWKNNQRQEFLAWLIFADLCKLV